MSQWLQTNYTSSVVRTAYDRRAYYPLRSQPLFEMVADVKPAQQPMPGSSVTFSIWAELANNTSTLSDGTDVTPLAAASVTQPSVTLSEYGAAVEESALLRATGFVDIDESVLNLIAYNAAHSMDIVAKNVLEAGTNVHFAGSQFSSSSGSVGSVIPTDTVTAKDLRFVAAKLRNNNAVPKRGNAFVGFFHPDVTYDLRNDTGASAGPAWGSAHQYASPQAIFAGEVGMLEGVVVIETPRTTILADSGSSTTNTDVYLSTVVGQQALAVASAIETHLVQSPIVDRLRRLKNIGWYALKGYTRFREAAIFRIDSASSIGKNSATGSNQNLP